MSLVILGRDLRAEMEEKLGSSELPVGTWLVKLAWPTLLDTIDVVAVARGADEAVGAAVIRLRKVYDIEPSDQVRQLGERRMELGEMFQIVMMGGHKL